MIMKNLFKVLVVSVIFVSIIIIILLCFVTLKKIKGASKLAFRYRIKGKKWSKAYTKSNKTKTCTVKGLKKKKT